MRPKLHPPAPGALARALIPALLASLAGAQTSAPAFDVTPLPLPAGCSSVQVQALGRGGTVLLVCGLNGGATRSFLWDRGELRRVGEFASGFVRHEALDINASGHLAGSSWAGGFPAAAWTWHGGRFSALGTLGGANAASFAINAAGQQTGWANVALPQSVFSFYAFLWERGRMHNLGELPGATRSCGEAIDARGRVSGFSSALGGDLRRAVRADTTLGMHELGTLGGLESFASDLDDSGRVVGSSHTGRRVDGWWAAHAFLWRDGRAFDLNDALSAGSGWRLQVAQDVDASGRIVGAGALHGQTRPFLLTPRP